MANDEHVALLKKDVAAWNALRDKNPDIRPDLSRADLIGADLGRGFGRGADGKWTGGANLGGANLWKANLGGANLSGAKLGEANLGHAELSGAKLVGANLFAASLERAGLVETDLAGADLTGCRIYGVSAWGLKVERTKQQNLVITRAEEPTVTVDNIEVAQFIYLLLHNPKIRDVIDTIGRKAVLILGRFTPERKAVLDCSARGIAQA